MTEKEKLLRRWGEVPPIPSFLKGPENIQGAHYKTVEGEQHHERAMRLSLNWYAGNITKYAERAPHKGQLTEDLIKVLDYTCMWLNTQELDKNQLDRIGACVHRLYKQEPQTLNPSETVPERRILGNADVEHSDATGKYVNQDGDSTPNSPQD